MKKCMGWFLAFFFITTLSFGEQNRIDRWFIFGTNLAWFGGAYGTDIGPNQAEGWSTSFSRKTCEKVFANLAGMGCPIVRIWAFERQEGLLFTPDLTRNPKYPYHEVTGLDPVFLENCDFIMAMARKYRVMVYWSLLNHLIREEQGGRHMRIIADAKVRGTYIRNALIPFVKRFGTDPACWAIDLLNEVDGTIGGVDALTGSFKVNQGCSWTVMRTFLKACTKAVHEQVPGVRVTATSGWHGHKNLAAGRFSGLGLDFYDWHSYQDDPDIPHARDLKLDKPVIIGECGPKTETPDSGFRLQEKNWRNYCEVSRKGYAGLLTWSYGDPGKASNFVMVNSDHSWRAGAKVIFAYTRGEKIPDAGPLLLTDEERTALQAINRAVQEIQNSLAANRPPELASTSWKKLGQRWKNYYPYLNPRYARLIFGEIGEHLETVNQNAGTPSPTLVQLARRMLSHIACSSQLAPHHGTRVLQRIAGETYTKPRPENSPAGRGFTPTIDGAVTVDQPSANPFGE
jgi:hypothetical protein